MQLLNMRYVRNSQADCRQPIKMPVSPIDERFRRFLSTKDDVGEIVKAFRQLCDQLPTSDAPAGESCSNYNGHHIRGLALCKTVCSRVNCQEAKTLLDCLTKRAAHAEYDNGRICNNTKVSSKCMVLYLRRKRLQLSQMLSDD